MLVDAPHPCVPLLRILPKPARWVFFLHMLLHCEHTRAGQSAQLTQGMLLALVAKGDTVGLKQLEREFFPAYHLRGTAQTGD